MVYYVSRLPVPLLPLDSLPSVIMPNTININSKIMNLYINKILPAVCSSESKDDGQYGSSAVNDVNVLQAISRRIHFGELHTRIEEKLHNLSVASSTNI